MAEYNDMSDEQETLLEFPCTFPIKAIGHSRGNIDSLVYSIVRQHVPGLAEGAIRAKPSKGGKYTAVTVTFEATSKQQLDTIYLELNACKDIVWVL